MKTLKQFNEETGYCKVKNPDEQKFIDKHTKNAVADANGNGDEVFKASNVKKAERKKERHGYEPGEDEKVYEELKGNQHKIDANKNGKVDAHDFKLLRKKKKVAEEAEQIDEISKKLAIKTYAKRNADAFDRDDFKIGSGDREYDKRDRTGARIEKKFGKKTLHKAIGAAHKEIFGEEAEQVDERWSENSKKTSKNLAAAALDIGNVATGGLLSKSKLAKKAMKWADSPDETTSKSGLKAYQARQARKTNEEIDKDLEDELKAQRQTKKSVGGKWKSVSYKTADGKWATKDVKEEVEQIDEISAGLARRAADKAYDLGAAERRKTRGNDASPLEKKRNIQGRNFDRYANKKEMANEQAEQIDELSNRMLKSYAKKANKQGVKIASTGVSKAPGNEHLARKLANRQDGEDLARTKLAMRREEAEQIDELSKATLGSYAKKAKDQMSRSDTVAGFEAGARSMGMKPGSRERKHNARADKRYRGLDMAINKLAKEEVDLFVGLPERIQDLMYSTLDRLNEDNQEKFMAACQTVEGLEKMIAFAIENRGE